MAGLIPFRGGVIARRITKVGEHSNPVIRSFIIFLRRGSYKVGFAHNPSEAGCFSMRIRPDETALQNFSAQAESTVHMLNWAIRSVKFLGVEFD